MENENSKKIKSCLTDPLTGKIPDYLKHYDIAGMNPYKAHIIKGSEIWINDNNPHNRTLRNYPSTPVESYRTDIIDLRTEEMKLADEIKLDPACVYSTEKYNDLNLKLKKLTKEYMQEAENYLNMPF